MTLGTTPGVMPQLAIPDRSPIHVYDNVLEIDDQRQLLAFLKSPGWAFGAYSSTELNPPRYWYKHFAGVVRDGGVVLDNESFEIQLASSAPLVGRMWQRLKAGILAGHVLTRCYANGYPYGSEGGVHRDSNIDTHFTAIYYPHLEWSPSYAGETVFFDRDEVDIIASAYPMSNRLIIFPGTIPHVARAITRSCPDLRITLMFKTVGPY